MKALLILILIYCFSAQASVSLLYDARGEIKYSVTSVPPKGAHLDKQASKQMGTCCLYIQNGKSFHTSSYIIYPRLVAVKGKKGEVIQQAIKEAKVLLSKGAPSLKVVSSKNIKSSKGLEFTVRYFLNGPRAQKFEAIGYAKKDNGLIVAVYSTLNKKDFDKNISVFESYLRNSLEIAKSVKVK